MSEKIPAGIYKARGVEGSVQYGKTANGIEQVAVDVELLDAGRTVTTFLFFSEAAKPYSIDRLKALGWNGDAPITGIGRNEAQVRISYEEYKGEEKMKVEVLTGGGRVSLREQLSPQEQRGFFAMLVDAGKKAGIGAPSSAGYPKAWDEVPNSGQPNAGFKLP